MVRVENHVRRMSALILSLLLVASGFVALATVPDRKPAPSISGTPMSLGISGHYEAVRAQEAAEAARLAAEQKAAQEAALAARLQAIAQQKASRAAVRPRPRPATYATGDDVWAALSRCEAGGRANAVSRNGKYFGAFQFSLGTWHSVGGSGNPIDYPYETQLHFAKILQARSGWGQWPVCSRKLGLR